MPLYPFTPTGVQDKLDELYLLPDPALAAQAELIKADFRQWMKDNFSLNTAQKDFLDNMDNSAVDYFGDECGFCFNHRLEIKLIYPTPPAAPNIGKWPEATNTIQVKADGNGDVNVGGALTFTMVYQ